MCIINLLLLVITLFIRFSLNTSILHLLLWPAIFGNMPNFVIFIALSCISFILWLFIILCYISIYIAVEASGLPIFIKIVFGFSNIHRYTFFSVYCSSSYFIILLAFCRFVSLFYWDDCHLLFPKCSWCCHWWISQYYFYNVHLDVLFQQKYYM